MFVIPTKDQCDILAKLGHQTFAETFVGKAYYTEELIAGYAVTVFAVDKLAAELLNPKIQYYLVQVDGEYAGYIKITERERIDCVKHLNAIYLDRFYLTKKFQRRGLGDLMLNQVFEAARARGYEFIWLSVWEHNTPALSFYRKKGFTRAGEWDWIFESRGETYTDLDYIFTVEVPRSKME